MLHVCMPPSSPSLRPQQLPRQASARFPALLRDIEAQEAALGVRSYGISITSMEEVFLALLQEQHARGHGDDHGPRRSIDGREGVRTCCRTRWPRIIHLQGR